MTYDFEVSDVLPARVDVVYDTWMSSAGHTAMTGAEAEVDPVVGGAHTAWNGHINGTNVELEPGRRIVQTWRTEDFSEAEEDSQIEVLLEPAENSTKITVRHTNVPDDKLGFENGGWQTRYFDPMKEYFGSL